MATWFRSGLNLSARMLNVILAIVSVLCYCAPYVRPDSFWPIHFLSYLCYFILIANIGFLFFWLINRKLWIVLPILTLFAGKSYYPPLFQWNKTQETTELRLKVMTFNTQLFRHFAQKNPQPAIDSIRFFLLDECPDIICIQEYSSYTRGKKEKLTAYLNENGYPFSTVRYFSRSSNEIQGMAIFSRYPIHKARLLEVTGISRLNGCMFADIQIGKSKIRVFNVHLQSNLIQPYEYQFFTKVMSNSILQSYVWKNVIRKMKKTVLMRSQQAVSIKEAISRSPYPVVVMGDFNDTPAGFIYRTLSDGLNDSFIAKGQGRGVTYNGLLPSFRIDGILFDKKIKIHTHKVYRYDFSDHYPVMAEISLP